MKAIKSIAVFGAAAGLLAGAAGFAAAADNDGAQGAAIGSPGTGSGNLTQVVTNTQTNNCSFGGYVAGTLNPTFGNRCVNE